MYVLLFYNITYWYYFIIIIIIIIIIHVSVTGFWTIYVIQHWLIDMLLIDCLLLYQ